MTLVELLDPVLPVCAPDPEPHFEPRSVPQGVLCARIFPGSYAVSNGFVSSPEVRRHETRSFSAPWEIPTIWRFPCCCSIPFAVLVIKSESLLQLEGNSLHALSPVCGAQDAQDRVQSGLWSPWRSASLLCCLAGKMKAKLKIVGLVVSIAAIAAATVPSQTLQRYTTLFSGTSSDDDMSADELSAVESTKARKMLVQESVRVMLEHPLFGVGPGIFSAALAKEQKDRGEAQSWHEAHNSYTQVGSEMGIPAFLMYTAVLLYSMKRAASIYKRTRKDPARVTIRRM